MKIVLILLGAIALWLIYELRKVPTLKLPPQIGPYDCAMQPRNYARPATGPSSAEGTIEAELSVATVSIVQPSVTP